MKLSELVGVIEMSQNVCIYKVGEDGCAYDGMSAHVPSKFMDMHVESVQAYEWDIDVLVVDK